MTHSRGIHLYTSPAIGNILNSLFFFFKRIPVIFIPHPPKYYNKQDIKCHSVHSREKVLSDPMLEGKLLFGKTVENCVGKAKKSPSLLCWGALPFKRNEGWNWYFLLQIEPCLNCRGAQAQSACSTDFSLRPPLIWALASRRRPAGLTEQPCQLGLSRVQIFSVINGSFQWSSPWQEGTAKWKLPRWSFLVWACSSVWGCQWGDWGDNAD